MKLLFAFKESPFPADRSGSRRRASMMLESLQASGHEVRLVHFSDPGDAGGIPRRAGFRRRLQDWLAPGAPLFRPYYESRRMRSEILRLSHTTDAAILGQDQMAIYRDAVGTQPCFLDATDAWTRVLDSLILHEPAAWKQIYLRMHRDRIERHIREWYHRFDGVLVVSERDATELRRIDPRIRIRVVPHTIEIGPEPSIGEAPMPTVLYAGVMSHAPNADGAVRLVREIWPSIRSRVKGARLVIAGRNPRRDVLDLACGDVEVTGTVPSIGPYLTAAWVVLCPMWSGAGMKTKVLEAMAAARPVVSTLEGVSGMPGAQEAGVRVEDDPGRFADAVVSLLDSGEERRERGGRLRNYVLEHFSRERTMADLNRLLTAEKAGVA